MEQSQDKLIREEQQILDKLIREMDQEMLMLDNQLTNSILQAQKAKEKSLPDTYGMLIDAESDKKRVLKKKRDWHQSRDELYKTRIIVDYDEDTGKSGQMEIKIGLHTYNHGSRIYITSWNQPLCLHYIIQNCDPHYHGVVKGKYGQKYETDFNLKLKRDVEMDFDTITRVTQFFPLTDEEGMQIVADEFLSNLLRRRSDREFRNIVFSIQRQQGEIIQVPFHHNLLVQGCAGSGKSMIMLHRLPVILFDNPAGLDRNNLYIITPSMTYIRMVDTMREELEIEDLRMGTLNQYYDLVIKRYGKSPRDYGTGRTRAATPRKLLSYVYSTECIKEIQLSMENLIAEYSIDYALEYERIGLEYHPNTESNYQRFIRAEFLALQRVLDENDRILADYNVVIKRVLNKLSDLKDLLLNRKQMVLQAMERLVQEENATFERLLAGEDQFYDHISGRWKTGDRYSPEFSKTLNRHLEEVGRSRSRMIRLLTMQHKAETETLYDDELRENALLIQDFLDQFQMVRTGRTLDDETELYYAITIRDQTLEFGEQLIQKISALQDPYAEYVGEMTATFQELESVIGRYESTDHPYIPYDRLEKLRQARDQFDQLDADIVRRIYKQLMDRMGLEADKQGRHKALYCSPYLYLQILYQYHGEPNAARESLITIDEAQNIEPQELKLIRNVNGNKVILNLFGDVMQHVEGSKGVDDWKDLCGDISFQTFEMMENYRNAEQITEYCNHRFNMHMQAINLPGEGVHEIDEAERLEESLQDIFQKARRLGLCSIIVKNAKEAQILMKMRNSVIIHDMVSSAGELSYSKWNLLTVTQAKGLEFSTVIAISGKMTTNEKYITYTRALDELYVFEGDLDLMEIIPVSDSKDIPSASIPTHAEGSRPERKKRVKRSSADRADADSINDPSFPSESLSVSSEKDEKPERKKRVKRTAEENVETASPEAENNQRTEDVQREKENQDLRSFFESKGLEVIDKRLKGGCLWVIGDKEEIGTTVDQARRLYKISGSYGAGRSSGFRTGWFTRAKR